MRHAVATAFCLFFIARALFAEGTLLHFTGNADDSTLINLVFLAEGYTESQEQDFKDDVSWLAGSLFSESPYSNYVSYFNTWGIFVASKESGADNPRENVYRDTYFGASYGKENRSLVTFGNSAAAFDLLAEHIPDYDAACLLVNDTLNGGSGGSIAVVTTYRYAPVNLSHEIGHTFAQLVDEYEADYATTPMESYNATSITDRNNIPWKRWILPETPIPTPKDTTYKNVVGLFEGALYQSKGWYRPKLQCRMRSLDTSFCEICSEAHILKFYSRLSPITSSFPKNPEITYTGEETTLSVITRVPKPNTIKVTWLQNGAPVYSGNSLPMHKLVLNEQKYVITAVVKDTTSLVRNSAADSIMSDSVTWNVNVDKSNSIRNEADAFNPRFYVVSNHGMISLHLVQEFTGVCQVEIFSIKGERCFAGSTRGRLTTGEPVTLQTPRMGTGIYTVNVRHLQPGGYSRSQIFTTMNVRY